MQANYTAFKPCVFDTPFRCDDFTYYTSMLPQLTISYMQNKLVSLQLDVTVTLYAKFSPPNSLTYHS